MIRFYLTLQTLTGALIRRVVAAKAPGTAHPGQSRDAGLSTLEIVVIALGLFLIAGVLVAVITGAVNSRLNQIN